MQNEECINPSIVENERLAKIHNAMCILIKMQIN
jgi:hypothetical protein